jgi:ferredoxin
VEPNTTVLLVYANRSRRDIIFAQELDELARVHAGRFTLRHVLGDRFDPLALGTVDPDAVFYVCGPEPMMATVRATLTEKGVSSERLFEERFSHGPKRATSREKRRVRVRMHGAERAFDVPPGSSILEASLAAGVQMPFSCALGGCGACRVKVVAGTVVTDEASCLSDRERADGYALACVASPLEDAILEAG